jgi:phosphoenolpyruvate carboxylase
MLLVTVAPRREILSGKESSALEQVRQKLLNTRKRMEDTLAGVTPDDDEEWYDTAEALAQPLLACYWSLWECGQPPCSSSS